MKALADFPTAVSTGGSRKRLSPFEKKRGAGIPGVLTGTPNPGYLLLTGAAHFVTFLEGVVGRNWIGNALLAAL